MKNYLTSSASDGAETFEKGAADRAAHMADGLLNTAEQAIDATIDSAKHGVKDLRERTETAAAHLGARAGDLAERGMNSARHTAEKVAGTYNKYLEATTCYVAEQPVRAVLISAAVGATVAAIVLASRSGHRR
jgi:ElaB/YqjD/DUF883 family membrane-anchored ribosome-binding protein